MIFTICLGIDENDLQTIKDEYRKLLFNRYMENDLLSKLKDSDKIYNIIYNIEYKEWVNRSPSIKKSLLIKDMALNKIIDISNTGFSLALKRVDEGMILSVNYANAQIELMNNLLKDVRKDNIMQAQEFISEGTVDLLYASGQTDAMSLRIGRCAKKEKNYKIS